MSNVLNLAIRKDVADEIASGKSDQIKLAKNTYWSKRLLENPKAKPADFVFKNFDVARVTMGTDEKVTYPILEMRGNTGAFYIKLDISNSVNQETQEPIEEASTAEPEDVNEVLQDSDDVPVQEDLFDEVDIQGDEDLLDEEELQDDAPHSDLDIEKKIDDMLTEFCNRHNVIEVNSPVVRIGHDGKVFGYNRRVYTLNKSEAVLKIAQKRFMHYYDVSDDDFVSDVKDNLVKMSAGNAVFIWKKKCNYSIGSNGHRILTLYLATERLGIKIS